MNCASWALARHLYVPVARSLSRVSLAPYARAYFNVDYEYMMSPQNNTINTVVIAKSSTAISHSRSSATVQPSTALLYGTVVHQLYSPPTTPSVLLVEVVRTTLCVLE